MAKRQGQHAGHSHRAGASTKRLAIALAAKIGQRSPDN